MTETDRLRFWEKVSIRGENECWPWLAARFQNGYGAFSVDRFNERAHRVALKISAGRPPKGKPLALHTCDNPACCNPAHLRWGSARDNARDAKAKDRNCRGERNGNAYLTKEMVIAIRQEHIPRFPSGHAKHKALEAVALKYGLRLGLVGKIVDRRGWKHIPSKEDPK